VSVTALATRIAHGVSGSTESPAPQTERSERLFEPDGPTLEDLVLGAWEELVADGRTECPVCGGAMSLPRGCQSCGAELS
jgi:hypothetical protein